MKKILSNPKVPRWLRFLLGGGINTLFTYSLYLSLNFILPYQVSYLLAYSLGILFSYWFNARIVFHTPLSWARLSTYPSIYLIQYAFSAVSIEVLVKLFDIHKNLAPLITLVLFIPVTYFLNKFILTVRLKE